MTLVLVRRTDVYCFRVDLTGFTRLLVPPALLALMLLISSCRKATPFEGTSWPYFPILALTLPVAVVSAVRSPNVARVSKSYEAFGDRFTTTIIDDLNTSDLSKAVKGQ
jgi:hypothetical protein